MVLGFIARFLHGGQVRAASAACGRAVAPGLVKGRRFPPDTFYFDRV
jgi:hypothetical protein